MKHPVLAPSVGESITEVSILKWNKQDGQAVRTGEQLLEIESDKATVEVVAEQNGVLKILKSQGERVTIGTVLAEIDDAAQATVKESTQTITVSTSTPKPPPPPAAATSKTISSPSISTNAGLGLDPVTASIQTGALAASLGTSTNTSPRTSHSQTKAEVLEFKSTGATSAVKAGERRVPMSALRARIAERLVQAQHTAAILTTFNEVDMSALMALRNKHKEQFKSKHGVALSFMSFFTQACIEALKTVPEVNASIDGKEIVYHDSYDMGVAVSTDRGLVVPIVKSAHELSFVELEKSIANLALKARDGKLSISEMSGGTFTISNGGVFGSLMSTPILNPPQSAILGMHKTQDRPVAIDGKVEIRPMMYLALSYDHRLIDGKGAVTFLVTVKDFIEHPEKLGFEY